MKIPYLIVWTGPLTGLQETSIAWSLAGARILAAHRKAKIFRLAILGEVQPEEEG